MNLIILYAKKVFNLKFFLNFFVAILIVLITLYFSKYNVLEYDDACCVFLKNQTLLYNYFIDVYHGKFIANFLVKFFASAIPCVFNIHPVEWIQYQGAIIKGFFFSALAISFSLCLFFKIKSYISPIVALWFFLYVQINLLYKYENELFTAFFSFIFPFIFYFVFWNFFFKCNFSDNKINININIIIISFLLGQSSECTSIASFFSILIFIIFTRKNIRYNLIYFVLPMLIGMLLFFLNPNFISTANGKGTLLSFNQTINAAIDMFQEYLQGYIYTFVHEFMIYTILIIIFSVFVYKLYDDKNKKYLLVLLYSLLIGAYLFFSLLLFAGRHECEKYCYVVHFDLILQMKIIFIYIIFIEIFALWHKKITFLILTIFLNVILLFPVKDFLIYDFKNISIYNIDYFRKYNYNTYSNYQDRYINERINAFYVYKGLPPVSYTKIGTYNFENYYKSLYNTNFQYDFTKIKAIDNIEQNYKEYLDAGGCEISNENIIYLDFNKLLDKNYILNCQD